MTFLGCLSSADFTAGGFNVEQSLNALILQQLHSIVLLQCETLYKAPWWSLIHPHIISDCYQCLHKPVILLSVFSQEMKIFTYFEVIVLQNN